MPATDILERLHAALVRALREDRRDAFGSPVTVAEIYQDLVPYRLIRADLGFEMNADYEHTVLRLLSGERNLAALEPEEARKELAEELDSPNPNVGLFRKFAGCDVQLRPGRGGAEADVAAPAPAAAGPDPWDADGDAGAVAEAAEGEPEEVVDVASAAAASLAAMAPDWTALEEEESAAPDPDLGDVAHFAAPGRNGSPVQETPPEAGAEAEAEAGAPAPQPAPRQRPAAPHEEEAAGVVCAFCDDDLPGGRAVRFCPHCGADQMKRPCHACGETLERGWRFCISCGAEAPAGA